ncbi:MAG: hypothetical protein JO006_18940 [Paucibacter sp.]|nr:hypothetical protein [Roseateles sp.]
MHRYVYLLPVVAALVGCDKLGIETPATIAARKEADGKAVGGACRNALRAIEDCYTLNPKANKAAVYAGWMEMDAYMRDNKLEGTPPMIQRSAASGPAGEGDAATDSGEKADKPEKSDRTDKVEKVEKADKTEKADKADKADKSKGR